MNRYLLISLLIISFNSFSQENISDEILDITFRKGDKISKESRFIIEKQRSDNNTSNEFYNLMYKNGFDIIHDSFILGVFRSFEMEMLERIEKDKNYTFERGNVYYLDYSYEGYGDSVDSFSIKIISFYLDGQEPMSEVIGSGFFRGSASRKEILKSLIRQLEQKIVNNQN